LFLFPDDPISYDNVAIADVIWAAAFFEAEGSVVAFLGSGRSRNSLVYKARIDQKAREIPDWFQTTFAGKVHVTDPKYNALGKACHFWELIGSKAFTFFTTIHPHLKSTRRRNTVEDMLAIWISRPINHGDDRLRCDYLCQSRRGRRDIEEIEQESIAEEGVQS
jgi:hypothetical protein